MSMVASTIMFRPPAAVPPDDHVLPYFVFDRFGVRVPALLISPWVERTVIKTEFDHTSLLKYLTEKWNLGPLTKRVAAGAEFRFGHYYDGAASDRHAKYGAYPSVGGCVRSDVGGTENSEPLNGHQSALVAFSEQLEHEIAEPVGKVARTAAMIAGATSQVETAKSRVKIFLAQQKAKAGGG